MPSRFPPATAASNTVRTASASLLLCLVGMLTAPSVLAAESPAVAVLEGTPWSPGDPLRYGAAEMEVLLCAAQLHQNHPLAGIVGVGNRRGLLQPATEAALRRVALMGLTVVRVARNGATQENGEDVFVEAGGLSPAAAKNLLAACLARFGAPPAAADPVHPTPRESAAIHAKLALFQQAFDAAALGATDRLAGSNPMGRETHATTLALR
ncbi:MAG: ansA 2 [Verrucomicrobia bacterium]|nr:ansA 2 [Verrucomicrobiota bacterium]